MRKFQVLTSFMLLSFMVALLAAPGEAAFPGIGKWFGKLLGKGATKQVAQKGAGRTIAGKAISKGAALMPQASKALVKTEAGKIFAKAAPQTWVTRVTPGQIMAVGGAAGLVVAGNSTANAIENVGSATADSLRSIGGRAAETLPDITEKGQQLAGRSFDTFAFYLFLLVLVVMTLLFWRFKMMPWHAAADKPAGQKASGSVSACADVKDAEIIEVEYRKDDKS